MFTPLHTHGSNNAPGVMFIIHFSILAYFFCGKSFFPPKKYYISLNSPFFLAKAMNKLCKSHAKMGDGDWT